MSQHVLKQSLSALMDNEADELELRRVLNASDEPELRNTWSRYQVARAAMHSEPFSARVDLSASIMAAIEAESAPMLTQETQRVPVKSKRTSWIGRIAVAASVTLAVLGSVRFYNYDAMQQDAMLAQTEQRLPAIIQSQSANPVVLASYNAQDQNALDGVAEDGQDSWYELRVPGYLRQHAQQVSLNKTESGLSYARAASLEGQ